MAVSHPVELKKLRKPSLESFSERPPEDDDVEERCGSSEVRRCDVEGGVGQSSCPSRTLQMSLLQSDSRQIKRLSVASQWSLKLVDITPFDRLLPDFDKLKNARLATKVSRETDDVILEV